MPSRSTTPAPPPVRTRRPRGSLSLEAILDAAESIASTEGFDALTMRAVATRLGAAPMALYNHVSTKEELVDALLDRVLCRFDAPPVTDDWACDLRAFARAHHNLLLRHPWSVAPLVAHPNPGVGAVRIGEVALGILQRRGLSGATAVATFSGIIALSYGWSSFTAPRDLDPSGPTARVAADLAALPRTAFPLTVAAAVEMGGYGSDAHFEIAVGQLLDGISLMADRTAPETSRTAAGASVRAETL